MLPLHHAVGDFNISEFLMISDLGVIGTLQLCSHQWSYEVWLVLRSVLSWTVTVACYVSMSVRAVLQSHLIGCRRHHPFRRGLRPRQEDDDRQRSFDRLHTRQARVCRHH